MHGGRRTGRQFIGTGLTMSTKTSETQLPRIDSQASPYSHGGKQVQRSLRLASHIRVDQSGHKPTNELLSSRGGVGDVVRQRRDGHGLSRPGHKRLGEQQLRATGPPVSQLSRRPSRSRIARPARRESKPPGRARSPWLLCPRRRTTDDSLHQNASGRALANQSPAPARGPLPSLKHQRDRRTHAKRTREHVDARLWVISGTDRDLARMIKRRPTKLRGSD